MVGQPGRTPANGPTGKATAPRDGRHPPMCRPRQSPKVPSNRPWHESRSHRISQSYATRLPTSHDCIASIDQRISSLETGCGGSVRHRRRPATFRTLGTFTGCPENCQHKLLFHRQADKRMESFTILFTAPSGAHGSAALLDRRRSLRIMRS